MNPLKRALLAILALESRLIVRKYKPYVIAVTGSVGKTSIKDAIYDVLKDHKGYVRKSEKSFNSEFGLPLTILGAPNAWRSVVGWLGNIWRGLGLIVFRSEYPDCLVLEVGADHPGDIARVTTWLKPDVAVISKVSRTPVHVEFFGSPDEVFEEKAHLATAVRDGGALVLFADDDRVMSLARRVKGRDVSVVSYGMSTAATMKGANMAVTYEAGAPTGFEFDIYADGTPNKARLSGILGETYMYPLLAAAAVGRIAGIPSADIVRALEGYSAPKGRMNAIPGRNGSTLIDDTYNSSPDAAEAALKLLGSLACSGKKAAALGDMMELGKFAADEHRRIGAIAAEAVGANGILVAVGQRSRLTADAALKAGMGAERVMRFDSSTEAAPAVAALAAHGDIFLVKGSQSVRMERVSAALLRDPARAKELLPRQEREWLEKA